MNSPPAPRRATRAWLPILLGNFMPLAAVLFFQWGALDVVFLYWLENAVIGLFNVLKMSLARPGVQTIGNFLRGFAGSGCDEESKRVPEEVRRRWETQPATRVLLGVKFLLVAFFVVHYSGFMIVHLMFILFLFGERPGGDPLRALPSLATVGLAVALGLLVAEHGYLFFRDYWRGGEYQRTHPLRLMFAPYPRILVMHLAILFGGFLFVRFSLPQSTAVALVGLKVAFELGQQRVAAEPTG